jgi:hypothetical protein
MDADGDRWQRQRSEMDNLVPTILSRTSKEDHQTASGKPRIQGQNPKNRGFRNFKPECPQ